MTGFLVLFPFPGSVRPSAPASGLALPPAQAPFRSAVFHLAAHFHQPFPRFTADELLHTLILGLIQLVRASVEEDL